MMGVLYQDLTTIMNNTGASNILDLKLDINEITFTKVSLIVVF